MTLRGDYKWPIWVMKSFQMVINHMALGGLVVNTLVESYHNIIHCINEYISTYYDAFCSLLMDICTLLPYAISGCTRNPLLNSLIEHS